MIEELNTQTEKLAVIYTRVSSNKQKDEGTGLETQEKLCREEAEQLGYTVLKVFSDGGISGKTIQNRPGMLDLLAFLKKTKEHITIFTYHIDRLGRDTVNNIGIINTAQQYGHAIYIYKSGFLEDTPTGHFMTTVQSAASQLEREHNKERTKQLSRNHVLEGAWIFREPIGYKFCKSKKSAKHRWLLRKEPEATIIQQALEKFATAELQTQTNVANFLKSNLEALGIKQKNWFDLTKRILTEEKYSGYFEYKPWGVPYQKGKIEALINSETFKIIQQRLKGKERVKHTIYNKNDDRFPLRRLIVCPYCGKPITGSLTKGGTFPYYQCQSRHCSHKRLINVTPKLLHADFESLLQSITPTQDFIDTARTKAMTIYQACYDNIKNDNKLKEFRIKQIDKEIANCFEKFNITTNPIFVQKLDQQVNELEAEKQHLIAELDNSNNMNIMPFDEAFAYVEEFLRNPLKLWEQSDIFMKRQIYALTFQEKLSYDKQNKFSEPKLTPIFKQIEYIASTQINTDWNFFGSLVPDLKILDEISELEKLKSGTVEYPQIFKDFHKKVVGNSFLVP